MLLTAFPIREFGLHNTYYIYLCMHVHNIYIYICVDVSIIVCMYVHMYLIGSDI